MKKPRTALSITLLERIRFRPRRWIRWTLYAVVVLGFIGAEYRKGFQLLFPLVFSVPVLVATWWDGRATGYTLAALSMVPWPLSHSWPQFGTRTLALILLVELVGTVSDLISHVRVLEGLLPICMHCHRIREAGDRWVRLEEYVQRHSEASFSHGICPNCITERYATTME